MKKNKWPWLYRNIWIAAVGTGFSFVAIVIFLALVIFGVKNVIVWLITTFVIFLFFIGISLLNDILNPLEQKIPPS